MLVQSHFITNQCKFQQHLGILLANVSTQPDWCAQTPGIKLQKCLNKKILPCRWGPCVVGSKRRWKCRVSWHRWCFTMWKTIFWGQHPHVLGHSSVVARDVPFQATMRRRRERVLGWPFVHISGSGQSVGLGLVQVEFREMFYLTVAPVMGFISSWVLWEVV